MYVCFVYVCMHMCTARARISLSLSLALCLSLPLPLPPPLSLSSILEPELSLLVQFKSTLDIEAIHPVGFHGFAKVCHAPIT